MGVTNLDHVRANTFLAQELGLKPKDLNVYVVGGHSGHSIVPLLSKYNLNDEQVDRLVQRIQYGGDEVVTAKEGKGSSTLSMAYAAHEFFTVAARGYLGIEQLASSAYISLQNDLMGVNELDNGFAKILSGDLHKPQFFSTPVTFDQNGIKEIKWDWINDLDDREIDSINLAVKFINENVQKGLISC